MFTGIIEEIGTVICVKPIQNMIEIEIKTDVVASDMAIGDSLSTNGVCLTVTKIENNIVTTTAMPETMANTTLCNAKAGAKVNLERAVQPTSRLGGHIVTGHVDGVEELLSITGNGLERNYRFSLNEAYARLVAKKGSIAINGISLTVTEAEDNYFSVSLIPHTLENTTLKDIKVGDKVNIEADIIARYLARLSGKDKEISGGLTLERMAELGY